MKHITSRSNPLVKTLRSLSQDSSAYRAQGQVWIEGDHLCRAALLRGVKPALAVFAESAWALHAGTWGLPDDMVVVVPDALFPVISGLESHGWMGFVVSIDMTQSMDPQAPTLVLDRVQDTGNVGAMLRCASAFGYRQVLSIKGTAALWSPKVLRAGMGAHFGLHLIEGLAPSDLQELQIPLLATVVHDGHFLHELIRERRLPAACAWIMGHEGQGVSEELMELAQLKVRIAQPGGEESLNVATAAAICLHASATAVL